MRLICRSMVVLFVLGSPGVGYGVDTSLMAVGVGSFSGLLTLPRRDQHQGGISPG